MPQVKYVERTIFLLEGFEVRIFKNGKDARSELQLPVNYVGERATKNSATVSAFKNKFKKQFAGYDIEVYNNLGEKQRGNVLLSTVRDTYLED